MKSIYKTLAVALIALGVLAGCSSGQGKLGLSVAVELEQGAPGQTIGPDYFQGRQEDRFRLVFKADQEGFLYVVNQGSSGEFMLLFPRRAAGLPNNLVKAGQTFKVPPEGQDSWMRFSEVPGSESITVFLSKNRIDALEQLFSEEPANSAKVQAVLAELTKASAPGGNLAVTPVQNETRFLFNAPDDASFMRASLVIRHQ